MNGADNVFRMIENYYSNTAVMVLAFIAVVIFWLRHKEKRQFLYILAALFVVLLNDGMYAIMQKIGEGSTYYRMLWLIPVTVLAGALLIWCFEKVQGIGAKVALTGCMIVAGIMFTEDSVGNWFRLPENIYLMPTESIEICDVIDEYHTAGFERVLFAEQSLVDGIRMYDANVQLSIGGDTAFLETMVTQGYADVSGVIVKAMLSSAKIDYVALKKEFHALHYTMLSSGCDVIGTTEDYYVYAVDLDRIEKEFLEVEKYDFPITNLEDIEIETVYEPESYILHGDGHIDVINMVSGEMTAYLTEEEEFQVYDAGEYYICAIDNSGGEVSEETFEAYLNMEAKPAVLLLNEPLGRGTSAFEKHVYGNENIKAVLAGSMIDYSRNMINETAWQSVCWNEENAVWLTIK